MKKRSFGNTPYELSEIGLGLAALGRPGYINLGHREDLQQQYDQSVMEDRTHKMLDLALELGINYFDAAQSYGKAELFLSSWLNASDFDVPPVVGSKWGYYYTADWKIEAEKHEIKEHSRRLLDEQWPSSRQRLAPFLKLYQIHSATLESEVLDNSEVLERLMEIKDEGTLIGLSLSGPTQGLTLEKARTIVADGKPLFDAVQATYNLLERSLEEALSEAHDAGMAVVIKEALANGRLTARNHQPAFANQIKLLQQIANKHHATVDQVALAFVLSRDWASLVLSGAAVPDHLLSNVKATSLSLDDHDLELLSSLKEASNGYWQIRSELPWN